MRKIGDSNDRGESFRRDWPRRTPCSWERESDKEEERDEEKPC